MQFFIIIILFAAASCQSADKASLASGGATKAGTIADLPCGEGPLACDPGRTPMVCSADRYDNRLLPDWHLLKGWGNSFCEARNNLRDKVCSAGLKVENIGAIFCAPDPSEGECAALVNTCNDDNESSYCFASAYDGVDLAPNQIIAGRGKGKCMARFDLKIQACQMNLKPSLLENIACLAAVTANDCPVTVKACVGDYFPFICEGRFNGGVLKEEFGTRVFAENSCMAEGTLNQIACNLNISPSKIVDRRCYADR